MDFALETLPNYVIITKRATVAEVTIKVTLVKFEDVSYFAQTNLSIRSYDLQKATKNDQNTNEQTSFDKYILNQINYVHEEYI